MSIQLALGGHSFSAESLPPEITEGKADAEFVLLTHKTLLVPREEFDDTLAGTYLQLAGMPCTADEVPVWSDPQQPMVAVMAADRACATSLRDKAGADIRFTTPLLFEQKYAGPAAWFYRTDSLLYIKVYDTVLRFAEVVNVSSEADLLCVLERLAQFFKLQDYTAATAGDGRKEIARPLRRYFKRVVCE